MMLRTFVPIGGSFTDVKIPFGRFDIYMKLQKKIIEKTNSTIKESKRQRKIATVICYH